MQYKPNTQKLAVKSGQLGLHGLKLIIHSFYYSIIYNINRNIPSISSWVLMH